MNLSQIVQTIVLLLGIIILGYYQRNQIKSLKIGIEVHKDIINGFKAYFDVMDVRKLKPFIEFKEKLIKETLAYDKMPKFTETIAGSIEDEKGNSQDIKRDNNVLKHNLIISLKLIINMHGAQEILHICGKNLMAAYMIKILTMSMPNYKDYFPKNIDAVIDEIEIMEEKIIAFYNKIDIQKMLDDFKKSNNFSAEPDTSFLNKIDTRLEEIRGNMFGPLQEYMDKYEREVILKP